MLSKIGHSLLLARGDWKNQRSVCKILSMISGMEKRLTFLWVSMSKGLDLFRGARECVPVLKTLSKE